MYAGGGTIFAQADHGAIFDYIETDSPQASITVDDRIRLQVESLAQFPERGRPGRVEGTRELVILRTPYIAAYRVQGRAVRILRILHGARRWPEGMSEDLRK